MDIVLLYYFHESTDTQWEGEDRGSNIHKNTARTAQPIAQV